MEDPKNSEDGVDVIALAGQVAAGTDTISIPKDLVDERPPTPVPEKALWARIRTMSVAEKVKVALSGNKDARSILLRDSNKLVSRLVLQNPRITEDEIIALARDRNTDEEVLRTIAENRDWIKIHVVRVGLVGNSRTPVDKALRLLPTMGERELSRLARSKDVPNVIVAQARRILLQMQRR
jgi:hypothetical protein